MTRQSEADVLYAILRTDFYSFFKKAFETLHPGKQLDPNWHLEAMAFEAERILSGGTKRLLVTQPPRSLKSIVFSVALAAYILGRDSTKKLICVSYSQELAEKHARDFRKVVNSAWFQKGFPKFRLVKDTTILMETDQGGSRRATSIGGTLTGLGGDVIIIDDPMRAADRMSRTVRETTEEFYGSTLLSRLDNKREGVIVLVAQRLHEQDLPGFFLRTEKPRHLNLPAIAMQDEDFEIGYGRIHHRRKGDLLHPSREPQAVLDRLRAQMLSGDFLAQYQQQPVPETGNMIKAEWLLRADPPSDRLQTDQITLSLDTAMKGSEQADYSVCTTWLQRDGINYLIDVLRQQCDFPTLVQLAVSECRKYNPTAVLIEDQGSGTSLIDQLRVQYQIRAIGRRPSGDKETRLSTASLEFERGRVMLPQRRTPWLDDLIDELLRFPQSRFKDQVDSISQYLLWVQERRPTDFECDWDKTPPWAPVATALLAPPVVTPSGPRSVSSSGLALGPANVRKHSAILEARSPRR